MKKSFFIAIVLALFFSGCSIKEHTLFQEPLEKKEIPQPLTIPYTNKITSGDSISMEVFSGSKLIIINNSSQNYQDLKSGYIVSSDGSISLPLVGNVQIAGLSENEASELLTKVYGEYFKFPFVKLHILYRKVYVIGEVQRPGSVLIANKTLNLFEALAQVGDVTTYANKTDAKIVSYINSEKPIIRSVDMTDVKSIQMANLTLRPNDIVYIPPRDFKAYSAYLKESTSVLDIIGKLLRPFVDLKYLNVLKND